jgi:2-polyprenyl-6-methoxyphenol hydroxylase-like FAD-dependent oxidoreductase
MNLSLRDVKALTDILIHARDSGLDFGSAATLDKYARARAADTNFRVTGTHALNQLVASDNPVISSLRRAGLRAVSSFSPLRRLAIQKGLTGGDDDDQDKISGRTTRASVKTSTR